MLLSDMPKPRDAFFGRASELAQLRTMLSLSTFETFRQKRVVLWGLGGFGKTRLALQYLKTHQKDYSAMLWINAATYDSTEESFTQAADILKLRLSFHLDAPLVGARANIQLVHQWLASNKNTDWLMVVDSLDDLESFDCRDLVPQCSHGSIVITSTLSHTMDVFKSQGLELGGLEIFNGCQMLLHGVGAKANTEKGIRLIPFTETLSNREKSLRTSIKDCYSDERSASSNRTGEGHDQTRNVGPGLSWSS